MSLEVTSEEVTKKICVICEEQDDRPVSKLGEKGCQGLSLAAKTYKDQIIVFVHIDCRKKYCHPNQANSRGSPQAEVFMNNSSHFAIEEAGENAFKFVYNGKENEDLEALRFRIFFQKVNTSNTVVQVQTLPPTKAASRFHSFRTYLQVQTWLNIELNPLEWGWRKENELLTPVKCN